jgi:hypothetical protein
MPISLNFLEIMAPVTPLYTVLLRMAAELSQAGEQATDGFFEVIREQRQFSIAEFVRKSLDSYQSLKLLSLITVVEILVDEKTVVTLR